ncbi:MAG: sugar MFS transporter [Oceanospirillaceae bacterium]|nr:sugar MFS transporter [Oceanospirillaceae bacterium]
MAGITGKAAAPAAASGAQAPANARFALVVLTSLFFMWGFITCLNDILIPHLKTAFDLSYTQAMLIQFCFFGAYFVVSIPAGWLVKRWGYRNGIVAGLVAAASGCALFYPAAELHLYPLFLGALFVLASGVTVLQVAANPYVTVLGAPESAPIRLNLTQGFNSLGTTVAPLFGALLILSAGGSDNGEVATSGAESVQLPYLLLASAFVLLALTFRLLKLPDIRHDEPDAGSTGISALFAYPHLLLGALGIFLYVGAEVAIGSLMISFFGLESVAALPENQAAHYVAYYWGGAMVGRFFGAAIMRHIRPGTVLACNALMACALLLLATLGSGKLAMVALLLIGLCNSVMFPTIFSLALAGLGARTSQGAGLLCLAIVGGAIVPLLQGAVADSVGVQQSYLLPILCYLYIAYYGLRGHRPAA